MFAGARGCVYTIGGNGGGGLYKFSPSIGQEGRILITGGNLDSGDVVVPVTTLSSKRILYTFGEDWGRSMVSGLVLLGPVDEGGEVLGSLISWWETNRATKSSQPVKINIPGKAYDVFVHRLTIGEPDPMFNIQPFSLQLLVAP